jgi:ATP-binding cassette subfamily B protein
MKPQILPFASMLPSYWETVLARQNLPVKSSEALLAWVELDLDAELRFEKSLLLLYMPKCEIKTK